MTFTALISEIPHVPFDRRPIDDAPDHEVEQISIPILNRNELGFDIHINPSLQFLPLRPDTPLADYRVETGIVRQE